MRLLICGELCAALCAATALIGLSAEPATHDIVQLRAPAGRDVLVQISREELDRLDWKKIYQLEYPGQPYPVERFSYPRCFGVQKYYTWDTDKAKQQPVFTGYYLIPAQFLDKYGHILRGGDKWAELPANRPQPLWLSHLRQRAAKSEPARLAAAETRTAQPLKPAPKTLTELATALHEETPAPAAVPASASRVEPQLVRPAEVKPKTLDAFLLTWTEDDPTGRLIGTRQWFIDQERKALYIAVSVDELRQHHERLYGSEVEWAWLQAFKDGFLQSVWYAGYLEPVYVLRADKFEKLKPMLDDVHQGRLPWQITRTREDDPDTAR